MGDPANDVLVCGGGPTGLVLALALQRAGVRVRVVDSAPGPGTTSRALVVHARTLEFYRQMGIVEEFLGEGLRFEAANLWVRGRRAAHVELGDIGEGLSAFPYMLVVPQDRHERFLVARLERAGVRVERGTELTGFTPRDSGVAVRLKHADGREEDAEAAWLAGCDGAHSRVRDLLGAGFPGGTYSHTFYVADVEARGPVMNGQLHVALDDADLLGVFPLKGGTTARLIGTVHEAAPGPVEQREPSKPADVTWEQVGGKAARRLGIEVDRVNWFSTYRVHHRVAGRFRAGRVFLLGDAAHIHSPVGAQGMNTGIGDAVNLAWKLAEVIQDRSGPELLDTYEPERIAFARRLVATTDRAFVVATGSGRLARFVRTRVVPLVVPRAVRLTPVRRFMFRTVSQIAIHYRGGRLASGAAGRVRGGDRLPWVPDNHAVLDGLSWQVHVYGTPGAGLAEACRDRGLPLHHFEWTPAMARAGFGRNALYLVRPDGHVAHADVQASARALERATALRSGAG